MMFCDIWLLTSYDERKCYSLKLVPSFLNVCLTSNIFLGALNYLILNTNSTLHLKTQIAKIISQRNFLLMDLGE